MEGRIWNTSERNYFVKLPTWSDFFGSCTFYSLELQLHGDESPFYDIDFPLQIKIVGHVFCTIGVSVNNNV